MVAVEHHAARRDVGDAVEALAFLHLHADREALAIALGLLDADELRVVFAERLLGLELQLQRISRLLALQRALELVEQLAVAAVHVGELGRRDERHVLRVVHLHPEGNEAVAAYDRRRFTRSKTSAAWPR